MPQPAAAPRSVRVEVVGGDPLGSGDRPVLSWWLPTGAAAQQAYRIVTGDGRDSDWVASSEQSYRDVPGPYTSRRTTSVQVQVRTDLGDSPLTEQVPLSVGLLAESDWTASWIGVHESPIPEKGKRPAYWLRTTFEAADPQGSDVTGAVLHVSALGLYEVHLNGVRVGDVELAPGWTQYAVRVPAQSYDVGPLLHPGTNVLAVLLADGWYRGQVGAPRAVDQFGTATALRLQLEAADGSVVVAGSDRWRCSTSHILAVDLIAGQREDRRLVDPRVHEATFDDSAWAGVQVRHVDVAVVPAAAPAVRRAEQLRPVSVEPRPDGSFLVDLGQNINGWVRLSNLGPAGTTSTLRHGEHVGPDGDLTTEHLDVDFPILPERLPLGQVDVVTSSGRAGDVFEPRFTTKGFRYVRVEGHPGPLGRDDVTGVVVHTDLRRTGWFACSDERVNRLHEAVVWSLRSNVVDVPTDCPQRERAPWTGDWQVFAATAACLFDVDAFTRRWLRDVMIDQLSDGKVVNTSPATPFEGARGPLGFLHGSAGWGDVVVSAPWDLWRAYGDESLLRELWPAMTAWLGFAARTASGGRHPARAASRPEPAPHEEFLWDSGFHWGEWLEPDAEVDDFPGFLASDKSEVATAYLHRSARQTVEIGTLIGADPALVAEHRRIADGARAAWQAEFLRPNGTLTVATQACHVRALAFGLVPDELRPAVARRLVELVADAGDHLSTGFLSTGLLLPALADNGFADTAYRLLLQDTEPSWLTMIERGATTVWERWNGVDAEGKAHHSLNHYSKGAVVSFLYGQVTGLRPTAPGYRTFDVRPMPGGGLTSAKSRHDSPYGPIEVAWRLDGGDFTLELDVPGGTTAQVTLPDGTTTTAAPGHHTWATPRQP
jgi:alpha-L-rhamnosidase